MTPPLAHAADLVVSGLFLVPVALLAVFYIVAARVTGPGEQERDPMTDPRRDA